MGKAWERDIAGEYDQRIPVFRFLPIHFNIRHQQLGQLVHPQPGRVDRPQNQAVVSMVKPLAGGFHHGQHLIQRQFRLLTGGVSPNRRKFRQAKFSPATIAFRSMTCRTQNVLSV